MALSTQDRGQWSSKLGFVLAAAGSAVGLGNIWKFPSEVAENGGAAFLIIYLLCCFIVGFPVMTAELTIGRKTAKNPVGAFKSLSNKVFGQVIGYWGIICGIMILAFYNVIAGWAFSFVFAEIFHFAGNPELSAWFSGSLGGGMTSALFCVLFMGLTITVVTGGISGGIEKATKTLMPLLIGILILMIVYVETQEGSGAGFAAYLKPDFSKLSVSLFFQAMGQAFFSLSLGMGALITYGSYLSKKQNIPEVAAYVTLADVGIAFIAGLLIIPSMYVAQNSGIEIMQDGVLISSTSLVFDVLPAMFHQMSSGIGAIFGIGFFGLLSMAALTSTISLLEVPTSYAIDELNWSRKKSALIIGSGIAFLSVLISFDLSFIGLLATIFNDIGLPLGGFMICIFLGYIWKTENALDEIREGFPNVDQSLFGKAWPFFVRYICPLLILIVFVVTLLNIIG
ncbi:MAG: sodium-dependent transporter [Rhodothermales bacterium]